MFEPGKKDVTYSNKDFNKVVINFVGIKTLYTKCHATFSSKSKRYNYLKTGCMEVTLFSPFA